MLPVDGGHLSEMSKLNGVQGLLTKQVSRLVLTPVPPAYLYLCRLGERLPGVNKRASHITRGSQRPAKSLPRAWAGWSHAILRAEVCNRQRERTGKTQKWRGGEVREENLPDRDELVLGLTPRGKSCGLVFQLLRRGQAETRRGLAGTNGRSPPPSLMKMNEAPGMEEEI